MYNYTLTLFDRKTKIKRWQFIIAVSIILSFSILSLVGIYRFGGVLAVLLPIIVLSSADLRDGSKLAIIKNDKVREIFGKLVYWAGLLYFIYTSFN